MSLGALWLRYSGHGKLSPDFCPSAKGLKRSASTIPRTAKPRPSFLDQTFESSVKVSTGFCGSLLEFYLSKVFTR